MRILIAEDNAVNQLVAVRMLENLGYKADVVANGREAVDAVSRVPYAAVLMDCQMPEMDGYEATGEIRKREGPAHRTPIIAMTAHALPRERERAMRAGMDDHISKPVKPEKLDSVLQRWLRADAPGGDPVDRSVLASLSELGRNGEPNFIDKLREMFIREARPRISAMQEALHDGDARALEEAAHALRGSSANLGAQAMEGLCLGLEERGRAGDLSDAPSLLDALTVEFERFGVALEAELKEG